MTHLRLVASIVGTAILFALLSSAPGRAEERWSKIRVATPDREALRELARMGAEFEGSKLMAGGQTDMIVTGRVLEKLRAAGIAPEILIEDLSAFYASRLSSGPVNAMGFGTGSMGGYYTLDEIRQQLDTLRLLYPSVVGARDSIGASLQGRPIWAVRMTANPDIPSDRPQVLFLAMHHAREPMAMMTLLYFMWHLAQGYGVDPEITYLLENRDLWIIPIMNVDGYEANRRYMPNGGGMRRKNMRDAVSDADAYGVDLCRNWDSHWALDDIGSSPDPLTEFYRGTAPFSEPEAQVLRDFCLQKSFRFILEYHSYGNSTLCPPGYVEAETADSLAFRAYLRELTRANSYNYGTLSSLYYINGIFTDWAYEHPTAQGPVFPFLTEIGTPNDGFWPAPHRILPLASGNLRANLFAAWAGGGYLKFQQCAFEDSTADGDLEAGEAFAAQVRLRNFGVQSVSSTVVSVYSASPWIELESATVTVNGIESNAETLMTVTGRVASNVPGGAIGEIVVSVSPAAQLVFHDTVSVVLGRSSILFADDAEQGMTNWMTNLDWGISPLAHSGSWSFTDSPGGDYRAGQTGFMTLRTPLTIPLTSVSTRLRFWTRWFTEASFDYGQVRYSSDRGVTWIPLRGKWTSYSEGEGYSGWEPTWVEEDIDLSFLAGKEILLRLALVSDGFIVQDGWCVDDITVRSYEATTGRLAEVKPLAFPSVAVAESDTLELILRNIGVAPVAVSSLSTTQPAISILSPQPLPFSIPGTQDSAVVRVIFNPDRHGPVAGTVEIASDDPFKPACSLPVTGFGVLLGTAEEGTLYAASASTLVGSSLFTLDRETAEATLIGPLETDGMQTLSVSPSTGELYGTAQFAGFLQLYRLSTSHGTVVPTASIPLPGSRAMAIDMSGQLYVATTNGRLYRVDARSGDTTLVGVAQGVKFSAMTFHPATGELWAADVSGTKDIILKVDHVTADTQYVGRTGDGQMTLALAFDQQGSLLALKPAVPRPRLVLVDEQTGAGTLVDTVDVPGIVAMAMRPTVVTVPGLDHREVPTAFILEQNYPNPFNPSTTIRYGLAGRARVTLSVFNMLGQRVATLVEGEREAGYHEAVFDASGLASGVYLYRLQAGSFVEARKLLLVR